MMTSDNIMFHILSKRRKILFMEEEISINWIIRRLELK